MNHIAVLLSFFILPIVGCVSVNLGAGKVEKASDVQFQEPKPPFQKIDNPTVDLSWQNIKNGNTIAFLSECNAKAEISIQTMETESLAALSNLKILKSEMKEFNEREAKEILAEGQVDGIAVKIQLMLFKKNSCNYTLSFVGRKKVFDKDTSEFQTFLIEFKAP